MGMTNLMPTESKTTRKIAWGALLMFAASAAACGGSPQAMTGTAPSTFAASESAPDAGSTFSTMKEGNGRGKGPGTTPDADEPTGDIGGPGRNQTQIEGMATEITGTCPALTIVING